MRSRQIAALTETLLTEVEDLPSNTTKLKKWFTSPIAGKKVVWSGDSTTIQLDSSFSGNGIETDGTGKGIPRLFSEFWGVSILEYGDNGVSLANFITDGGTAGYGLTDMVALNADCYVICWGINDVLNNASTYTAAQMETDLRVAVNTIRAGVPKAVIILRMPNTIAQNATGISGAGNTAQLMLTRIHTAYRALQDVWDDVLVWDSSILYSDAPPATYAECPVLNDTDGYHPSVSAYHITMYSIMRLLVPDADYYNQLAASEAAHAMPLYYEGNDDVLSWRSDVSPEVLQSDEYYKVYRVNYNNSGDASYYDFQFFTPEYAADAGSANQAANLTGSISITDGLRIGDIVSFNAITNTGAVPLSTFVLNKTLPTSLFGGSMLRFTGADAHPSLITDSTVAKDVAILPTSTPGFVYRHKYAFCPGLRYFMETHKTLYEEQTGTAFPYTHMYRFAITASADGSCTLETIASEPDGNIARLPWDGTELMFVAGLTANEAGTTRADFGLDLSGATLTPNIATGTIAVTLAGVDFRNYTFPQGYIVRKGPIGTPNTGVIVKEAGGDYHHTTRLEFYNLAIPDVADNAASAVGKLLYTLPAGNIVIESAYMSVAAQIDDAVDTDTPDVGLGTVIGIGAVAVLDTPATFENIITGQTAANMSGTETTKTALPTAGTPFVIEEGSAKTVHLNMADTWADTTTQGVTITGTVVLKWHWLGY